MLIVKRIILSVWAVLIVALAMSTFWLDHPVYGQWWFVAIWGLMAALLCWAIAATRMWRSVPSLLLHTSFLLILAGGACTWLWGERGVTVVSPGGEASSYMLRSDDASAPMEIRDLPKSVALDSFVTHYYPGSVAPRDYVSYLRIEGEEVKLSVNHPVDLGRLRLYQQSYLPDGSTVIGITDDRCGTMLSFAGYALFAIGAIMCLVNRRGRWRTLLRGLGVGALLALAPSASAAPLTSDHQVLYNGRVTPLSTPATQFLLKVYGERSIGGLDAEDAMKSMLAHPDKWRTKRFIKVKDRQLLDSLGVDGKYVAVTDLFDSDGAYRLRGWYDPYADDDFNKAILQLDEKVELILRLYEGDLFAEADASMRQPHWRVVLENVYNRLPFPKVYFMGALALGLLCLIGAVAKVKARGWRLAVNVLVGLLLAWQVTGYAMMWIIYGRVPLGNTVETLLFVSILVLLLGLWMRRYHPLMLAMCLIVSGFASLVANLSQADPMITPLMPVLSSPWLGIHVALVMTAYSLLVIACIVSATRLRSERARDLSLVILYPAVMLLALGIFTGSVWAEVAWGRYWAWDPKETWALITLMVYAVPLHRSLRWFERPVRFNTYVIASSLTMIMTYFGVNYLGGLHAY